MRVTLIGYGVEIMHTVLGTMAMERTIGRAF
jgi:hypothetical protein